MKSKLLVIVILLALFLRVWGLDRVPVSLFGDEIDMGYHAYSLLHTGRDYLGNFMPFNMHSLADNKSPLYTYSITPTVAIFGISPWGVRLPAAIFGVLNILILYFLVKLLLKNESLALLSAFLLTITPWHIQYSRAGFEETEMLLLYMAGLYFFFRGLQNHKLLILSAVFSGLSFWAYHSAKIFLPLTILSIVTIWWKQIKDLPVKWLLISACVLALLVVPIVIDSVFGGGAGRFTSTSIFSDPTYIPQIGADRLRDAKMQSLEAGSAAEAGLPGRVLHNLPLLLIDKISNNYLQSFSPQFLFISGDPILRHSLPNQGEFYKFEVIFLILGLMFIPLKIKEKKTMFFLFFWLLAAPIPSIITRDGGSHATRLLFMLPPLIFVMGIGMYYSWDVLGKNLKKIYIAGITALFILSFVMYQHSYWNHYPWDSEKWWQAGYREAVASVVAQSQEYDKIIISNADEPSLIFFLGWSQFPPGLFQKSYPLKQEYIPGFGSVFRLDKYYFPPQGTSISLYDLGKVLPENTLYLATAKEININLIAEPNRVPVDVKLVKAISYPSGSPAFYLFKKPILKKLEKLVRY